GGELERVTEGMMQHAQVVYLDEVFNGSSAILNSLLSFMNERVFHDRGRRTRVDLNCLFAATNRVPESPELRAVFDRFVLRCRVDNIDVRTGGPDRVHDLMAKGWTETFGQVTRHGEFSGLLAEAHSFRKDIQSATAKKYLVPQEGSSFYERLTLAV